MADDAAWGDDMIDLDRDDVSAKPKRERRPMFDPEYIRDISEKVYRIELGPGGADRMVAKDKDGGKKLRNRAAFYDGVTRTYLKVLGFEPDSVALTSAQQQSGDQRS